MTAKAKNLAVVCLTAVFLLGFLLCGLILPDKTESNSERRPLASFPEINTQSVLSGEFMTGFDKYSLDNFPLRDSFRTLKAVTAFYVIRQKDNNGIYITDGSASKLEYPLNSESISYAAERFDYVYRTYLADSGCSVYVSLIPDKSCFASSQSGALSMDYGEFASELESQMSYAQYIDIMDNLTLSDYYSTDSHWRQEKITDVAEHIAAAMGTNVNAEYELRTVDTPFCGVYYGQSALPLKADTLCYLNNNTLDGCSVFDMETQTYIPVYDLSLTSGRDPYEMFLSGSKSLLTIENPAASTDKELIIFRDSFGSSLAPLLAEGYSKITLVDIRYISPSVLGRFISFGGQDVLFIYSTSVLNNSVTIK